MSDNNEKQYPVIQIARHEVMFWQDMYGKWGVDGADEALRHLQARTEKQRDEEARWSAQMTLTPTGCVMPNQETPP